MHFANNCFGYFRRSFVFPQKNSPPQPRLPSESKGAFALLLAISLHKMAFKSASKYKHTVGTIYKKVHIQFVKRADTVSENKQYALYYFRVIFDSLGTLVS